MFKFLDNPVSYNSDEDLIVHLHEVTNKAQLLQALHTALSLPEYFGFNWDALFDCLVDLHWVTEKKVIIVHDDLPALSKEDNEQYLDLLYDVAVIWANRGEDRLQIIFPAQYEKDIKQSIKTDFCADLLDTLTVVIRKFNLQISEHRKNYLKLQNEYFAITLSHDVGGNSYTLWLVRNGGKRYSVEVGNTLLKTFFKSGLQLSQVPRDVFISNTTLFLAHEAQPLLSGDAAMADELEAFSLERSRKYTQELLDRQNLQLADKAWKSKNYKDFILLMNKISPEDLPNSYVLKYKMAQDRL